MRQIGTLPRSTDAKVFGDYLLSLGVSTRAVEGKDGWAIWVHDEDKVARARAELDAFQADPEDPRFAAATNVARAIRQEEARLDQEYRKNLRPVKLGGGGLNARRRPLTVALMAVCIVLFLACETSERFLDTAFDHLGFFSLATFNQRGGGVARGLDDIRRGEVWRAVTPVLMHANWMHLIFNMLAMASLSSVVEYTRGTKFLALFCVGSAVLSNFGQLAYCGVVTHELMPWLGISGVAYALFGYIWIAGQTGRGLGVRLHPASVQMMLFFLVLGFLKPGFHLANGAHLAGLFAGVLFALAGL